LCTEVGRGKRERRIGRKDNATGKGQATNEDREEGGKRSRLEEGISALVEEVEHMGDGRLSR
jgi:hypothetical protein